MKNILVQEVENTYMSYCQNLRPNIMTSKKHIRNVNRINIFRIKLFSYYVDLINSA